MVDRLFTRGISGADGLEHEVDSLEHRPPRPGLPPLLLGGLSLWAAAAVVFFAAAEASRETCTSIVITGAVFAGALLLAFAGAKRRMMVLLALVFASSGVALGGIASLQVLDGCALAESGSEVVNARVLQDSSRSDYGFTTVCQARTASGEECKVRLFTDEESYLTGDELSLNTTLSPLKEQAAAFYRTQGICGQMRANKVEKREAAGPLGFIQHVRAEAIRCIQENAGGQAPLMEAIICGYRQPIAQSPLYGQFKTCGIAHIIAVSGAHASIVLALLMALLKRLRTPRTPSIVLSVLFVVAYLIFAGMPISAIRSSVMAVLALLSFFARRRSASLNSLGLCLVAFIITDPVSCLSMSLFLSAASTLGIVLFSSLVISWFPRASVRVRTLILDPAALTFSSNLMTLPFSAAIFSLLSLIAPVANIAISPLFALACASGLIGCAASLLCPIAAPWFMTLSSFPFWALSQAVQLLSSMPYAAIPCSLPTVPMLGLSIGLCIALWMGWPGSKALLALAGVSITGLVLLLALSFSPKPDEVSALDVGQGDAILITSGTANVLIDTGNSDAKLREELGRKGVHHLDAVVISHPDDDHCASLETLGRYVQVDRILFAEDVERCGCERCARLLSLADRCAPANGCDGMTPGECIRAGRFTLTVLWPFGFADEGGNGDSLCLLGCLDVDGDGVVDWQTLFTGDAESEQIEAMIERGLVGDVDVLKVGHHGSRAGLTEDQARQISPEIALISVGAQNRYGHPTAEALQSLEGAGSQVFRTDESGTVTVRFSKERMTVSCLKQKSS